MTWRRALLPIVILAAAIPALWWLDYYRWAGGFRQVTPHFAGTCRAVEAVPGPEDLLIDHQTATAYVSSYDRGAVPSRPGAILAYDLNRPGATPRSLTAGAAGDFRPHGISLYRDPAGRAWLHAINHPRGGDTVEIYELQGGTLTHVRTVRGAALTSANDVVAVAPDRFYVTNSRRHSTGLRGWLESSLRLARGNVVYYDGSAFHITLDGVAFPNGIDFDDGTGDLFIVSSFDQSVRVYARDASTGALTFRRQVAVGTRLDNVNVTPGGDLWVAGRARYLGSRQPSQVVRIAGASSDTPRVEEVYVNDGAELANASAAAVDGRRLLIGASRGTRFLDCTMR